jgi:hypothetical protein
VGLLVALPGLALRVWASGHIHKDQTLATTGPFGRVRHPLYVGSFFVGFGLVLSGRVAYLLPMYLLLFGWLYLRAVRREEEELEDRFGTAFMEYKNRVPAFFPRGWWGRGFGALHGVEAGAGFQPTLFRLNRGWEAPLGALMGFGLLGAKMVFFS